MTPETHYADAHGTSVAYQVFGDGPNDVLVIPGAVSHVELLWSDPGYQRFMRGFSRFARVMTYDKRGTGMSDPVQSPPTLDERADDARAVLDAVGVERATVFGWSEGGTVAVFLAAASPERTERLVLCSSFACGDYPDSPAADEWHRVWDRVESLLPQWGDGSVISWGAPTLDTPTMRRFVGALERASCSPAMIRAAMAANRIIDVRHVLPSVRVPTLVLHRRNEIIPIAQARYLADNIPGARLVEFEGVDHWPFVGDVDAIVEETEEFITGTRAATEPDRMLATVMFTDIVRSTELAAELGDAAWRDLLQRHDDIVREQLAIHRGREVKHTGDGFLAVFDAPARGIQCAKAIVQAVHDFGLKIRAGLHCGECEMRGDDIGGLAVHIGARIGALASADEVLVSGTLHDLLLGSSIAFADRGVHTLKGVPGEWHVYALAGAPYSPPLSGPATPELTVPDQVIISVGRRAPALGRLVQRAIRRA